jgi:hypothetical protein
MWGKRGVSGPPLISEAGKSGVADAPLISGATT